MPAVLSVDSAVTSSTQALVSQCVLGATTATTPKPKSALALSRGAWTMKSGMLLPFTIQPLPPPPQPLQVLSNVFNFFKDSADNLEAALSAANPAKTFSARTTASNPASGPALDRVPFGRTEKVKQGPRGPGKAKEKKEDDEDFEWRVREEVARRLEVERRVREEMREKERHNAGEEAMLQPAANQALPEAAEGEEVDDEWWQITDEPKPNAATNPIPIPSIPEKTTAVATLK
ncbi:MAG: hypothetical protein LQ350_002453 [Teloschistes chrysophthalmus]|nr:MAG: hypothetical protein LQ350_002453 [Niorma chrysophthalma]